MTSYNETASPQNLWEGNIALYLSRQGGGGRKGGGGGNSALLPANVDRRQRDLINFLLENFQLDNKSLVPRETVNFVSLESQCDSKRILGKPN